MTIASALSKTAKITTPIAVIGWLIGHRPIVRVPLLEVEVCDIASLTEVGRYLLGPASTAASDGPQTAAH